MKLNFNQFLFALIATVLFSSCASLTGFEEGKTLGEDNSEIGVSANYTRSPDLFDDEETLDTIASYIGFPNLEFNYKYGVSEKLDIGAKVSTNLNSSAYAKYQLVGDKSSKFALSPGLELGSVLGAAYSVGIPVYTSFYPTPNFAINVNPRFMYQFITIAGTSGAVYLDGNVGLMFGRRHKFGIDIGYYNVGVGDLNRDLVTFGFGGKFRFGDFDSTPSKIEADGGSRNEKRSKKRRRKN